MARVSASSVGDQCPKSAISRAMGTDHSPLKKPVALIAGPTASGKSELAVSLALALEKQGRRGAVVNADSAQVYADLRILSARPRITSYNVCYTKLLRRSPIRERSEAKQSDFPGKRGTSMTGIAGNGERLRDEFPAEIMG